jgi:hypothetical protein
MQTEPWIQNRGQRRNNEILSTAQRFGELVSVVIVLLILGFYVYNQVANTGFFTSNFVGWTIVVFYGTFALSILPPLLRATIGKRSTVRPFETAFNFLSAAAFIFLLAVFPFNFAHFPDALPQAIRFMFSWVSNDVAKIAMVLAILGTLISGFVNGVKYLMY